MQVVPSAGVPVETQNSRNNLDVVVFDERTFLAFRTAPTHFASEETELHVVSSTDEETWTLEASYHLGRDLREPRFLVVDDELVLYFAVLGTSSIDFEPGGARRVTRRPDGSWTEPAEVFEDDFIPWRTRVVDGRPMAIGYTGGAGVYDVETDTASTSLPALEVQWLTTDDGWDWTPFADTAVVWTGGGSETDLALTPTGDVVAVMRNEAGDQDGFGSKICTAPAAARSDWTCSHDPRKYDSPLVFSHGGRIWLIGRRNLTPSGHYDVAEDTLDHAAASLANQAAYWNAPKRCSLWEVDPESRTASFVLDLAGRGDTCFASILPLGDHRYAVYNYSSPVDGPDVTWLEGQLGETFLYRQILTFPAP